MPNISKPSRACHLCRKRRVKCDFTLPGCLRCAKIQKECPGYRIEQDLLFRNQDVDSFALNYSARTRRKKREKITLESEENSDSSALKTGKKFSISGHIFCELSRAQLAASSNSHKLSPQIAVHWDDYSIPIVLHQFFAPYTFAPELYKENNAEDSCLSLSSRAVAKAYFLRLACALPNDKELVQIYGRALRTINSTLEDPKERVKDSTILAVWLMAILELIVNSPKRHPMPTPVAYNMHCQGLSSLFHSRGHRQFSTKSGRGLFLLIYRTVLVNHLISNTEGHPESLTWFSVLRPHLSSEEKFPFAVCTILYRISKLYPRISKLYPRINTMYTPSPRATTSDENEQGRSVMKLTALLTEVDAVQSDIRIWPTKSALQSSGLDTIYLHNILRAAQLKLQYLVSLLISKVTSDSDSYSSPFFSYDHLNLLLLRRQQCHSLIHSLSLDILSSVPPAFGDQILYSPVPKNAKCTEGCWVDALQLLFPIVVVCRIPAVLEEQREKALRILQRIGTKMGIGFALGYALGYRTTMLKPFRPIPLA